jgi:selenium metabolism protein YedF
MEIYREDLKMGKVLDARGWPCPKPVIETKKALQTENILTVIVDNRAARENVSRLASKSGYSVQVEEKDDDIYLHIEREAEAAAQEKVEEQPEPELYIECGGGKLVLFIASDTIGRGNDELGGILMRAFMPTFLEVEPRPETIILMNNGVKLAVSDSPVLEDLQALADEGAEILVCGTCLNYFGLMDNVAVGEISNAYTIAEMLLQAGRVVRL